MFITFNKWILENIYEDNDIIFGKMIDSTSTKQDDLANAIKMSPTISGTNIRLLGPEYPQTIVIFKSKGDGNLPDVKILPEKIDLMEKSINQYRYLRTETEKKRMALCSILRKAMGKGDTAILSGRLEELFIVGIQDKNTFVLTEPALVNLSRTGKVVRNEVGNSFSIEWETSENHAAGVLFINAYETIQLSLSDDKEKLAKNIERHCQSTVRTAARYIIR